jgi:hypothetical protein
MNISINVKKSHVAAIVSAILIFAGVQVAEATLLSSAGSKLCVSKSGAVFARTACKSNEKLFSVMPGKIKKKKITETILGESSGSNLSPLTVDAKSVNISSLDVLSNTLRAYTKLITIPAGTPTSNDAAQSYFNKNDGLPVCPSDAPIAVSTTITPTNLDTSWNWMSPDGQNFYFWENSNEWGDYDISLEFGDLNTPNFAMYIYKNMNHGLSERLSETPIDLSMYVSVTCIPTVNLVASN